MPFTVRDVVAARADALRPLVYVEAQMSIADVIDVLANNGLISAPVKDVENDLFIGIANLLELFSYAGLFDNAADAAEKLAHPVVRVLESFPDTLSMWKCDQADGFAKLLLAFRKGIHRVLVFDEAHPTASASPVLISQSDVVKYINCHPELVEADLTIGHKGLGFLANEKTGPVVSVAMETTAAGAFKVLAENEMSAVPVVDAEGRIVGTLSASDLRGSKPSVDLSKPVLEYLQERHARGAAAPVSVGADAKIGEVLIPLSYSGVHRVWVVDGSKRPVGVVSMTDVIGQVASAGSA